MYFFHICIKQKPQCQIMEFYNSLDCDGNEGWSKDYREAI